MFTGIIELAGRLRRQQAPAPEGARIAIEPDQPVEDLKIGESVAVNGVCLTVEPGSAPENLQFFVSPETLQRTTLGGLPDGSPVNLERSLRADSRLGGHWVMGHVDATGVIKAWQTLGESWNLEIEFPLELAPLIAVKGSIAVDGISLTVAALHDNILSVAVIPHTVAATNLRDAEAGRRVNLEADVLARYVSRALGVKTETPPQSEVTMELLQRAGFVE